MSNTKYVKYFHAIFNVPLSNPNHLNFKNNFFMGDIL